MSDLTDDEITARAIEQALRELPEPTREQAHDAVCEQIRTLACSFSSWDGGGIFEQLILTDIRRLEHATRLLRQDETKATQIVPGNMYCAKCSFVLVRTNLYVNSGTTGPGDNRTEPCPNGCGPLWPQTWHQLADEYGERLEQQHDRIVELEAEIAKLREKDHD